MGNVKADFDIAALYAALDAERASRGMSWAEVARSINALIARATTSKISASTITGIRSRRSVEGDGVLQMLRWLGRTPESFVPGATGGAALPSAGDDRILRFDTRSLHAALDAARVERGVSWTQMAREIGGVSAAGLTRLSQGGRTFFPEVARITRWLGRPIAEFVRAV
jgi:hypothetical protein